MLDKEQAKQASIKVIESEKLLIDKKQEKLEKIRGLIPGLISDNELIDVSAIEDFIGVDRLVTTQQGYSLNFAGKGLARMKASLPTQQELKIEQKQSKDYDKTDNVIIRGDNLDVLKLLRQSYEGKIKMIYIDPPYNTGSDGFVYTDNFRENEAELIEKYALDEDKIKFFENIYGTQTHSGWLYFMYPRLKLARDLLTDDGVIFISIDDNEQANLKIMCDEIFGSSSFVSNIIWQDKYTTTNDKKGISSQTDNILCYCRDSNIFSPRKLPLSQDYIDKNYKNRDDDPNGRYMTVQMYKKKNPNKYKITSPSGREWTERWNYKKETMEKMIKDNRIYWGKKQNSMPRKKVYLSESRGVNPTNLLMGKDVGYSENGGDAIEKIFDDRNIFVYPKPPSLIKHLSYISTQDNDIVLDFFAGSGTTAEAVMRLNKEDLDGGGGAKVYTSAVG